MIHYLNRILILFILALFIGQIGYSQNRPKVALVLSGGAAKGFAHIGVLKVLEEAGLKPDIIVGTSMGSIMGGMYSIGYSANDLDSLSRAQDWGELLSNKINLNELNFENKYYHERLQVTIPIKKGKISLPTGIVDGQKLQELLSRLTFGAQHYESFEEFPIKFNAVATNIENGQVTYLRYGDLAKSLRASMAIPTFFSPVEIDGEYYVDGGIVNNFPIERAKELGADIIIGVNVGGNFDTGEKVNSMIATLVQTAFIVSYSHLPEQMELLDLYIEPDLKGYGSTSFSDYDTIVQRGYDAAIPHLEKFKEIANRINEKRINEPLKERKFYVIDEVRLKSDKFINRELEKFILGKINVSQGDTLTKEKMDIALQKIRAVDILKNLFYNVNVANGKTYLDIDFIQKEKAFVGATINYNLYQSFGLTVGFKFDNLFAHASKIRLMGRLSENPKANFSYLKYIGKRQNGAFLINLNYTLNKLPIYEDRIKTNLFNYHFLDINTGFILTQSKRNVVGVTGGYRFNDINPNVVSDTLTQHIKSIQNHYAFGTFFYEFNNLNSRVNPTDGLNIKFVYEQNIWNTSKFKQTKIENPLPDSLFTDFGSNFQLTNGYQKLRLSIDYYPKFHRIVSGMFKLDGNGIFSRKVGGADKYYVGGFESVTPYHVSFWGLNYLQAGGVYNYVSTSAGLKIQAFKNFFVNVMGNYMLYHDPNQRLYWDTFFTGEKLRTFNLWGVGLELTYQTIVGPIKGGIAYSGQNPNVNLYIAVGFDF